MEGKVLKDFWEKSKMTQKEFAEKIGMSQSALNQIFNSKDIRTGTLEKVCDAFDVKINDFYLNTPYLANNSHSEQTDGYDANNVEILRLQGEVRSLKDLLKEMMVLNNNLPNLAVK